MPGGVLPGLRVIFRPTPLAPEPILRPRPASPRPAGRTVSPPPELGGGSAGMEATADTAAMAVTATPGSGGPSVDARLDQETTRWLRWDKVRGARWAGSARRRCGALLPLSWLGAAFPAASAGRCRRFFHSLPSHPGGAAPVPPEDRAGGRRGRLEV